jgi:fatty-acyl-CoA synthase
VVAMVLEAAASWDGPVPGRDRTRIVVAGAPPPTRTIERVETELGWEMIQIYGLTETAPLLTINRTRAEWDDLSPADRAAKLSRAGVPAVGIDLAVDGQGEVLARGNHILKSYWDQPDASADALDGGWFHTGDGGDLDEGGYLTISDRKKDVIISGGENVSSIEVEDALFSHPAVAEVAVIGVPDERWGESVRAIVVPRSGTVISEPEVIQFCRDRLGGFQCPRGVTFVEALPRTATGKVLKRALRETYWSGQERRVGGA